MKRLYDKLATWVYNAQINTKSDYQIYRYGIQVLIEQSIFFGTCIMIALYMDMVLSMFLFLFVFYLLRSYIGGFHCKKYINCYFLSVAVAVFIMLGVRYISMPISVMRHSNFILLLCCFVSMLSQKKCKKNKEFEFFLKKLSLNICVILCIVMLFGKNEKISMTIMLTICIVILSTVLEKIKNKFGY